METFTDESDFLRALRATPAPSVVGAGSSLADAALTDTADAGSRLRLATRGIRVNDDGCDSDELSFCGAVLVTIAAGEDWDGFVKQAVEQGWVGLEALSGIAATIGSAVAHNVGAYGRSVGDTLSSVRTWDRLEDRQRTFPMIDCGLEVGSSRFSRERLPDGSLRFVVLEADFLMRQGTLTTALSDPELTAALAVSVGARVELGAVRATVLTLRSTA